MPSKLARCLFAVVLTGAGLGATVVGPLDAVSGAAQPVKHGASDHAARQHRSDHVPSADQGAFPSLPQLRSLTNYTSTMTTGGMTISQSVHSATNYKSTMSYKGANSGMVQILYQGQKWAQLGNLSSIRTHDPATPQDVPSLYSEAKGIAAMARATTARDRTTVMEKSGSCDVAGTAGTLWEIAPTKAVATYLKGITRICTAASDGALLSVEQTTRTTAKGAAVSTNLDVSYQVEVTSIGGVPTLTPADL